MGLLERIAESRQPAEQRFSVDQWLNDYLIPSNQFLFNNNNYPFGVNQTMLPERTKEISNTLPAYMHALRQCPPAFAAQMVRATVLSQARFVFRSRGFTSGGNARGGNPRKTFGNRDLKILEKPWVNGTTGELLSRMEWHAGIAGNSFVTSWQPGRLRVLRPDWVVVIFGSHQEPDDAAYALDGEVIGYAYCNGGFAERANPVHVLLPDEVAHWAPMPDPLFSAMGMSWLTPAIREMQGDLAMTEHKLRFFSNGATPNMVVKGIMASDREKFNEIVDQMESRHTGVKNAYRTLYLTAGADATVVGTDLKQMDFRSVQSFGETRISVLSRVHPVILGLFEGLSGSSLNAGNFSAARRMFADFWIYPSLQDVAASLAPLINVPPDAELWFDTTDMPILREDARDAAEIQSVLATTIVKYVVEGFTPESSIAAVMAQDPSLLVHTGLLSVQLQPPGGFDVNTMPPPGGVQALPKPLPGTSAPVVPPPKPAPPKAKPAPPKPQ